jgi:hypothetical protein
MDQNNANQDDLRDPVRVTFDESEGFLMVQLDKNEYGFRDQPARFQGQTFQPKSELHITIISRDASEIVKNHLAQQPEASGALQGLIDATRWLYCRLGDYYHVREDEAETIIEMVEVPELQGFFSELSRMVGQGLVLPPTHVTLYTYNRDEGIGLPTGELLEQLAQPIAIGDIQWEQQ